MRYSISSDSETMFSFELSATDFILSIAIVTLFALFLSQRRGHATTEASTCNKEEKPSHRPNLETKDNKEKKQSSRLLPKSFLKCVHHFGYLKNLPQNTPIPDECFGCPEVMRCLFPNEQTCSEEQAPDL